MMCLLSKLTCASVSVQVFSKFAAERIITRVVGGKRAKIFVMVSSDKCIIYPRCARVFYVLVSNFAETASVHFCQLTI